MPLLFTAGSWKRVVDQSLTLRLLFSSESLHFCPRFRHLRQELIVWQGPSFTDSDCSDTGDSLGDKSAVSISSVQPQ